jgi:2-oxoisovalerate dehydrogenase E2 component (dihydrolipoyl transacylase)
MATYQFKLPDIGEGIAEAEIVAWHVKVGDKVEEDQQLADMMTDKATVEMESPVAGTVTKLAGEVGDQVAIGSVLVEIETAGDSPAAETRDEQPLADGIVEPTAEQAEEMPVMATADPQSAPKSQVSAPAPKHEPETEVRPAQVPPRRRPPARLRSRHRPCPGEDCQRPHPPRRP